jgi:hypothetical protein
MDVDDRYESGLPCPQNEIDIFSGSWSCELPAEAGAASGGWAKTFVDPKITWFFDKIGGVRGATGFELGPLEAGHSWMAQSNGVKSLISVEANRNSFLKCLIVKNIMGMNEVQFKLGDSIKYLESRDESFDFILASGILYHLKDPLSALELILSKTKSLLVWTHYFDKKLIEKKPAQRVKTKPLDPLVYNGKSYEIASYGYQEAVEWSGFCGGLSSEVVWLERSLYLDVCKAKGFETEIFQEEPDHPHGPAFCFSAIK